jgi:hypothetical protein
MKNMGAYGGPRMETFRIKTVHVFIPTKPVSVKILFFKLLFMFSGTSSLFKNTSFSQLLFVWTTLVAHH